MTPGLQDVQVRLLARLTAPDEDFQPFPPTLAVLMREEILAVGRFTPGQLDSCTGELRDHLSQPGTFTCPPTIWQAWGLKTRCSPEPVGNPGHHRAAGPPFPLDLKTSAANAMMPRKPTSQALVLSGPPGQYLRVDLKAAFTQQVAAVPLKQLFRPVPRLTAVTPRSRP